MSKEPTIFYRRFKSHTGAPPHQYTGKRDRRGAKMETGEKNDNSHPRGATLPGFAHWGRQEPLPRIRKRIPNRGASQFWGRVPFISPLSIPSHQQRLGGDGGVCVCVCNPLDYPATCGPNGHGSSGTTAWTANGIIFLHISFPRHHPRPPSVAHGIVGLLLLLPPVVVVVMMCWCGCLVLYSVIRSDNKKTANY